MNHLIRAEVRVQVTLTIGERIGDVHVAPAVLLCELLHLGVQLAVGRIIEGPALHTREALRIAWIDVGRTDDRKVDLRIDRLNLVDELYIAVYDLIGTVAEVVEAEEHVDVLRVHKLDGVPYIQELALVDRMCDRLILLLRDQCIDQIIAGGGQKLKLAHERIGFIALREQLEAIGDRITDDDGILIEIEHALILLQRETVGRGLCARLVTSRLCARLRRGRYSTAVCNGAARCRRRNRRTHHRADLCQCREAGRGYHRCGQKCSGPFSETLLHKHALSSMAAKPAVF